jgi:NAD(P)-dependent dehydrogenase (short-subunit alcohol dehydrogenase family)
MAASGSRVTTSRSVHRLMRLTGRRALVIGGAGRLGRVAVATLRELGAKTAVLDLPEVLRRTSSSHGVAVACDLRDDQQTRHAIRRATRHHLKGLEILVHSAAYTGQTNVPGWATSFDRQTVRAWEEAMRVNVTSAFIAVQEARQALAASGRGSVIFLASIYGVVGPDQRLYTGTAMHHPIGYDVSKGGLLQLTKALATTLAPKIRVNAISPGGVWDGQPETFRRRYIERTPLKRMATPEDVKGAIAYLASDLSAYVTGHNLIVDGGWTIW